MSPRVLGSGVLDSGVLDLRVLNRRVPDPRRARGVRVASATLLLLMLSLAAPPGRTAESALTLEQVVRRAVERAPALDARRAQTVAAREDAHRAAALPDPKLVGGIDNLPVTGAGAFDVRADDMTMKRIGLMQEFPARAKRDARQALADSNVEQAAAMTASEDLSVRRAAAEAWIERWAADRELDALQAMQAQSGLAVRIAGARLAGAGGTVGDALAARAAALDLDNRIDTAHARVEAADAGLSRWLGTAHAQISARAPDFALLPFAGSSLLAAADRQGPLLAWDAREHAAAAAVTAASAEKRADWSVGVVYGQRDRGRSNMLSLEFSIGLPLFTANRQDRDIAARQADYAATLDAHEDARRAQIEQVQRDLAQWAALKRQVARDQEQLLPLARDRAATALAAYRGGGALQPWVDARRDEIDLRIAHAQRLGEFGRAWAALAYLLLEEHTP